MQAASLARIEPSTRVVASPVFQSVKDQFGWLDTINPGWGCISRIALGEAGLNVDYQDCADHGAAHADGMAEQWQHGERLPGVIQLEGSGSQCLEYRAAEIRMAMQLFLKEGTFEVA